MKKIKISKKSFEKTLSNDFGSTDLVQSPYVEDGKKLTLYYLKDAEKRSIGKEEFIMDLHIATWMNGEGWVFDHAEKHKLSNI